MALKCSYSAFRYLAIDSVIEDRPIALRRTHRVKLHDALIAATALSHGLQLLTLDEGLQAVMNDAL